MRKLTTVIRRRPQPGARSAFTHVELLVVLVCLSILATLLVPAIHASKQQRGRLGLLSALRTLGTSMDMYVDDHDEYLPGPLYAGQYATYSLPKLTNSLPYYLWPYVGANPPTSQNQTIPAFVDAYREDLGFPTIYERNSRVLLDDNFTTVDPFGYPNSSSSEPMPISIVENPSSTRALRDASKEDVSGHPSWWFSLPAKPIYGTPSALFFDGHVESVPRGRAPLY